MKTRLVARTDERDMKETESRDGTATNKNYIEKCWCVNAFNCYVTSICCLGKCGASCQSPTCQMADKGPNFRGISEMFRRRRFHWGLCSDGGLRERAALSSRNSSKQSLMRMLRPDRAHPHATWKRNRAKQYALETYSYSPQPINHLRRWNGGSTMNMDDMNLRSYFNVFPIAAARLPSAHHPHPRAHRALSFNTPTHTHTKIL